jgi:phosphohistidine phosphatase
MKTLLLMRHAKSSWAAPGLADHDRPLNERGERASLRMGRLLVERTLRPDALLHSTALRAVQTALRVVKAGGLAVSLDARRELYLAPPHTYIELARDLPDDVECALLIGHNPGLEELVSSLSGEQQHVPTAALAEVRLNVATWSELTLSPRAEAVRLFRPKELD